jgi:SNF2 family DNA or RNA helicase
MMTLAELNGDRIAVHTEYRDRDLIRAVPGARYDPAEYKWHVPLSWAGCLTLRGLFRERLEIGPQLAAWAYQHRDEVVAPAMAMRVATEGAPVPGGEVLYQFQRAGVHFLSHIKHALLCDEMGTGKTIQSIWTIRTLAEQGEDVFPILIAAPNNMKATWRREFKQWWPDLQVEILEGGRADKLKIIKRVKDGDAQVLVANWEALRHHSRLSPYGSTRLKHCVECDPALRGDPELEKKHPQRLCERCSRELNEIEWHSIIADEAHRAKDPKAKQTRALWALRGEKTLVRLALTGTPIANAPEDLWSALHFIDPESWPTRGKYIDRWCLQTFNPFGGMTIIGLKPETKDEFFAITDPHVRRMPKSLVLSQLPEKMYQTRYVEMSPKQHKAYEAMRDDMVSQVEDAGGGERVVAVNPLTQLTRLTQFASAYAELDGDGNVHLTEPSNKIDALMEILDEVAGKPIVVFAQSRQLIELASKRLEKDKIPHGMIVGGQTADERQNVIDRFQRGDYQAVLATVQAGGVGITLTRADTLVFLQRSWSMVDNSQAEDRVHRIGSEIHESITILDIVSKDTIEEGQRLALQAKTDRLQEILRDADLIRRMEHGEVF